jgi:hypothetical protein
LFSAFPLDFNKSVLKTYKSVCKNLQIDLKFTNQFFPQGDSYKSVKKPANRFAKLAKGSVKHANLYCKKLDFDNIISVG